MSQKLFDRVCGFCGKDVEGVGRYVYPLPGDPALMDNRVGKLACADCGAEQYRLQVAQGLVEGVQEAKAA